MNEPEDDIYSLARRVADALEAASLPYAVGGAIAYNQWGYPRGSTDIDFTVFVDEPEWPKVFPVLASLGAQVDPTKATESFRSRGIHRFRFAGTFLDIFVPSIPFYESVRSRVVTCMLRERPAPYLTAEDLTVFKFLFFRPKDMVDVQYMLAAQGTKFDRAYVRSWLVDMVGEADERVTRWDALCREVPVPTP